MREDPNPAPPDEGGEDDGDRAMVDDGTTENPTKVKVTEVETGGEVAPSGEPSGG